MSEGNQDSKRDQEIATALREVAKSQQALVDVTKQARDGINLQNQYIRSAQRWGRFKDVVFAAAVAGSVWYSVERDVITYKTDQGAGEDKKPLVEKRSTAELDAPVAQ